MNLDKLVRMFRAGKLSTDDSLEMFPLFFIRNINRSNLSDSEKRSYVDYVYDRTIRNRNSSWYGHQLVAV